MIGITSKVSKATPIEIRYFLIISNYYLPLISTTSNPNLAQIILK